MNKKNAFLLSTLLLVSSVLFSQNNPEVEMADTFYQSGKIYVVIGVLSIVFIGIIFFLFRLDRKITKIETELNRKS